MNTANSQYISLKMNIDFIIRQIARYPPHKIRKTSSKTIRKINLSKI